MYIYNGNEENVESQFDSDGMFPVPPDGSFVKRMSKRWSVVRTVLEGVDTKPKGLPLLKIYLTDQS